MKRKLSFILSVILLLGMLSVFCFAGQVQIFYPIANPTIEQIVGKTDSIIDQYYDEPGQQIELYFNFDSRRFQGSDDFIEYTGENFTPKLRAIFDANLVGTDYATVTGFQAWRHSGASIYEYYYIVRIKISDNKALRAEMDRIVDALDGLTDRQKAEVLYYYLNESIDYDEDYVDVSGTETALLMHKGVCMGYTRAMQELCRRLGIPCFSVDNDTHIWNCVYIDGAWKMTDVTNRIYFCDEIQNNGLHSFDPAVVAWAKKYMGNRSGYIRAAMLGSFTDLNEKWYVSAIGYCLENHLFEGTSSTQFTPGGNMSRAMFVTVLGRMAGVQVGHNTVTKFKDVKSGQWYTGYVAWAADTGIVNGMDAQTFAPDGSATREQICKMMVKYCQTAGIALRPVNKSISFKDEAQISGWAKQYVRQCQTAGLVNGDNGSFYPTHTATRAQVATIFYNLCTNYNLI